MIPKSEGKLNGKAVPWWTEECRKAIKDRDIAFKAIRRNLNF